MGPLGRASMPVENLIFAILGVPLGGRLAWVDSSKRHARKHHIGKGKGQRQSAEAAARAKGAHRQPTPRKLHGSPPARSNQPHARAKNTR